MKNLNWPDRLIKKGELTMMTVKELFENVCIYDNDGIVFMNSRTDETEELPPFSITDGEDITEDQILFLKSIENKQVDYITVGTENRVMVCYI